MKSAQGLHKLLDPNGYKEYGSEGASMADKKKAQKAAIISTYNENLNRDLGRTTYSPPAPNLAGFNQ